MTDVADYFDRIDARLKDGTLGRVVAFFIRWAEFTKRWISLHKEKLRLLLMMAALALFCTGLFLSLRAYPGLLLHLQFSPLLAVLFLILPTGLAISAIDFQILARLSDVKVGFGQSLVTIIYTRAANLLPIPGSMAVRMAVLKSNGVTFRKSGSLMFLFTAIWGGVGFCFSTLWLLVHGSFYFAAAFGSIGIGILSVCCVAISRSKYKASDFFRVAGLRLGLITLEAFALLMAMQAIGAYATYQQTAILVVASFVASIVPAGIGVRETLVAALSPIAGIEPAIGFLAVATVRVTGITFLAICSLFVLSASKFPSFELRK